MDTFTLQRCGDAELLRRTKARFAELNFSQDDVLCRLGLNSPSHLAEASRLRAADMFPPETAQDDLIVLFIFGQPVQKRRLQAHFREDELTFLIRSGLLTESSDDMLQAPVFLFPFSSLLLASDRADYGRADEVWTPSGQTFSTQRFFPKRTGRSLDIGTGNGILAILLSRYAGSVHAIDINPRAIEFAQFNAWFNECSNIEYETVPLETFVRKEPGTFDFITGVFPDLMMGSVSRVQPISRVVPDGARLLADLYDNLDRLLEPEGVCVFWHGLAASRQSIRTCFEDEVIKKGRLLAGYEGIELLAVRGGQATGNVLFRKTLSQRPPVLSHLSPSLGFADSMELFELVDAREWFHSMRARDRQDVRLRITDGLSLSVEHRSENGRFQAFAHELGRYRLSPDAFELLSLVDGTSSLGDITDRFLRKICGNEAISDVEDRELVDRTMCDLVNKGIVRPEKVEAFRS